MFFGKDKYYIVTFKKPFVDRHFFVPVIAKSIKDSQCVFEKHFEDCTFIESIRTKGTTLAKCKENVLK